MVTYELEVIRLRVVETSDADDAAIDTTAEPVEELSRIQPTLKGLVRCAAKALPTRKAVSK
jgi:hypothetical protein